jgi:hypothetical protein
MFRFNYWNIALPLAAKRFIRSWLKAIFSIINSVGWQTVQFGALPKFSA